MPVSFCFFSRRSTVIAKFVDVLLDVVAVGIASTSWKQ
jgi:hypothetical protein